MGRAAKYSADQLLDVARDVLVADGPAGVSAQAVAATLGAPSGSVYYRFASRDLLMASLWLRSVERFQAGLFGVLDDTDAYTSALRAAQHVLTWSRTNLDDARVLMVFRRSDLLAAGWPTELAQRNAQQLARVQAFLGELAHRLGATEPADSRRVRFAVVDIPHAAAREALLRGVAPEPELDALVSTAARAVLAPFATRGADR